MKKELLKKFQWRTFILKTAVGSARRERLWPVSLLLLAKWSVNSRYCLNPKGEFIGCSEMSLEQQKQGIGANEGCFQLPNLGLIVGLGTGHIGAGPSSIECRKVLSHQQFQL